MARDYDIALAEAQIIWEPVDGVNMPPVQVVGHGYDDDSRYISSWGSCNMEFAEASDDEKLNLLMRKFVQLVVAEGISPTDVHRALMVIPEYREALADDGTIGRNAV